MSRLGSQQTCEGWQAINITVCTVLRSIVPTKQKLSACSISRRKPLLRTQRSRTVVCGQAEDLCLQHRTGTLVSAFICRQEVSNSTV